MQIRQQPPFDPPVILCASPRPRRLSQHLPDTPPPSPPLSPDVLPRDPAPQSPPSPPASTSSPPTTTGDATTPPTDKYLEAWLRSQVLEPQTPFRTPQGYSNPRLRRLEALQRRSDKRVLRTLSQSPGSGPDDASASADGNASGDDDEVHLLPSSDPQTAHNTLLNAPVYPLHLSSCPPAAGTDTPPLDPAPSPTVSPRALRLDTRPCALTPAAVDDQAAVRGTHARLTLARVNSYPQPEPPLRTGSPIVDPSCASGASPRKSVRFNWCKDMLDERGSVCFGRVEDNEGKSRDRRKGAGRRGSGDELGTEKCGKLERDVDDELS